MRNKNWRCAVVPDCQTQLCMTWQSVARVLPHYIKAKSFFNQSEWKQLIHCNAFSWNKNLYKKIKRIQWNSINSFIEFHEIFEKPWCVYKGEPLKNLFSQNFQIISLNEDVTLENYLNKI